MSLKDIISLEAITLAITLVEQNKYFKPNPLYYIIKADPQLFYCVSYIKKSRLYMRSGQYKGDMYIKNYDNISYTIKDAIIISYNLVYNSFKLYNNKQLAEVLIISRKLDDEVFNNLLQYDFETLVIEGDDYVPDDAMTYYFKGIELNTYFDCDTKYIYGRNVKILHVKTLTKYLFKMLPILYPNLLILNASKIEYYDFEQQYNTCKVLIYEVSDTSSDMNDVIKANANRFELIADYNSLNDWIIIHENETLNFDHSRFNENYDLIEILDKL